MSVLEKNKVLVEKTLHLPVGRVFEALGQGKLFFNCSGDVTTFQHDFRVGGSYRVPFKGHGKQNAGKFLEIVPDRKVVFTWGDEGADSQIPFSTVTIELTAEGDHTRMRLEHAGFEKLEDAKGHDEGWTSVLADLLNELERNQLRIVRQSQIPVEKLFAACSRAEVFYKPVADVAKAKYDFRVGGTYTMPHENGGSKGEYLEIIPNQKIRFTWESGCGETAKGSIVTLNIRASGSGSTLELLHEKLPSANSTQRHRVGWSMITNALLENQNSV